MSHHHLPVSRGPVQGNRRASYEYIDPNTLRPLYEPRAQAPMLPKEGITPANVSYVSTLQLLRCHVRIVRVHCKRMWEAVSKQKPSRFFWDSLERDEQEGWENRNALRKYVAHHITQIDNLRYRIGCSTELKDEFAFRNRSGCPRHRMW